MTIDLTMAAHRSAPALAGQNFRFPDGRTVADLKATAKRLKRSEGMSQTVALNHLAAAAFGAPMSWAYAVAGLRPLATTDPSMRLTHPCAAGLVVGDTGTGKTMFAFERSVALARQGRDVVFWTEYPVDNGAPRGHDLFPTAAREFAATPAGKHLKFVSLGGAAPTGRLPKIALHVLDGVDGVVGRVDWAQLATRFWNQRVVITAQDEAVATVINGLKQSAGLGVAGWCADSPVEWVVKAPWRTRRQYLPPPAPGRVLLHPRNCGSS